MSQYWFISTRYRRGTKLLFITFILAFIVILMGAYTRLTDAGLSCPDWPHCYGLLTAPHTPSQLQQAASHYPASPINTKKAWTEMAHRYAAGTESVLIFILAASFLMQRKSNDTKSMVMAVGLIFLLCIQVSLGMLTVTEKLKPIIVVSHLLIGISLLSILWWAYLDSLAYSNFFAKPADKHIAPWLWLGFSMVCLQITLGGWVSTHYAGLACIDFPYCNGRLLPPLHFNQLGNDLITIHMLHRIGAFITAIYLGFLAIRMQKNTAFKWIAIVILALISLQITLSILNIIWLRPVWIALIHQLTAILLLLALVTSLTKASLRRDYRHAAWLT